MEERLPEKDLEKSCALSRSRAIPLTQPGRQCLRFSINAETHWHATFG